MKFQVSLSEEKVKEKLREMEGTKVESARGGTLIIVSQQADVSEARINIEKLLETGDITWLSW